MKKILKLNIFLISLVILVSCSKDFLDVKPLDRVSDRDVFEDPTLIELYVNNIYVSVTFPLMGYGSGILKGAFVDEIHDMWRGDFADFNNCALSADEIPGWDDYDADDEIGYEKWGTIFKNIRACNVFLEKVDEGMKDNNTVVDGVLLKDRLTGEVHFLRAFLYHQLVSLWGGVPIIEKTYLMSDDFAAPRNTYEECIDFIVAECDLAAGLLPEKNTGDNLGRATKGAALALKSEALLYAASDLHANNSIFSGYSNPELLGYTSGDQQARWTKAKNAAKAVIDLNLYSLYKSDPGPSDSVAQNYAEIFNTAETEEDIYVRFLLGKYAGITAEEPYHQVPYRNNMPLVSGPNGYHLWGQNSPTSELVDDYEMADGSTFDWDNPAHAAAPYTDREPRFYASILFEGVQWMTRPEDGLAIDPESRVQVGSWQKWDAGLGDTVIVWGLDTRQGPIEPYNGGYTHYYLRKFLQEGANGQYEGQDVPWRYFRYGEILLNYAEACIELGEDAEARTYINMIRKRAGLPDITESGDALRDRYRHERRIELAMEDNRFYDVRRWVIGEEGYRDATGVNVVYKLLPDLTTATVPTITPGVPVQERSWDNKAYFFPFMRDELNKNNNLIQNPGY